MKRPLLSWVASLHLGAVLAAEIPSYSCSHIHLFKWGRWTSSNAYHLHAAGPFSSTTLHGTKFPHPIITQCKPSLTFQTTLPPSFYQKCRASLRTKAPLQSHVTTSNKMIKCTKPTSRITSSISHYQPCFPTKLTPIHPYLKNPTANQRIQLIHYTDRENSRTPSNISRNW